MRHTNNNTFSNARLHATKLAGSVSRRVSENKLWHNLTKTTCVTAIAFLLSTWLVSPFTFSASSLFSSPEQSDFQFSDIFTMVANSRPVSSLDDKIVVVDIGNSNRGEIAETLETLRLGAPRTVGIDLFFSGESPYDAALIASVDSLPGTVLPVYLEQSEEPSQEGKFSVGDVSLGTAAVAPPVNAVYGAVNLPTLGDCENPRVRLFPIHFPMTDGSDTPSFTMELARQAYPDKAKAMLARGADNAVIDYASREFTVIPADELGERLDEVADKIVIVGALNDSYDMHATPLNSYQPGAMVHAYALSTILRGVWYEKAPGWLDYVLSVVVCWTIIFLCITLKPKLRGLVVRILQVVFLYLAVRVGYSLYIEHHVICNFSYTILMIAFGLFANDLWNGLTTLIGMGVDKVKALNRKLRKKKNHDEPTRDEACHNAAIETPDTEITDTKTTDPTCEEPS